MNYVICLWWLRFINHKTKRDPAVKNRKAPFITLSFIFQSSEWTVHFNEIKSPFSAIQLLIRRIYFNYYGNFNWISNHRQSTILGLNLIKKSYLLDQEIIQFLIRLWFLCWFGIFFRLRDQWVYTSVNTQSPPVNS